MMNSVPTRIFGIFTLIGLLSLLSGCGFGELSPTQTPAAATQVTLSSPTPLPTETLLPPSPTPTLTPAITDTPVPASPTSRPPTVQPGAQTVQIFLIALGDNGQSGEKIGCDDSVVPVQVSIAPTLGVLRAALKELLSLPDAYYGESGLYNSLHQSDLELDSVSIVQGKAIIHLSGTMMLSGVCDNPRVEAQLEETALQFSTVSQVSIFVNGVPLEEVLSLK